jgi:hypothetical protein
MSSHQRNLELVERAKHEAHRLRREALNQLLDSADAGMHYFFDALRKPFQLLALKYINSQKSSKKVV